HMIAVAGQTGESVPLYCTAHGKALLADCTPADLKAIYGSRALAVFTPHTINSIERLAKTCAEINRQGDATDDAEYVENIRCVAAPIRDRDGSIIGSIGISAPMTRFPKERYAKCAEQVMETAGCIGKLIGDREEEE